jgi:alpha-galactosidase
MWRTGPDIGDPNSDRTTLVGFQQAGLERFAGPGRWNDPDMLMVGLGKLDVNENRMQMSLWCLLAAPLLASADLTKISSADLAILTNPEVIAIDQDPAGVQGYRVFEEGPLEVWVKPLADGSKAVGLFNHDERATPVTASFKEVGIRESASVRDLWARKTLGVFKDSFTAEVPTNGAVLLRMTPDPGKFRGE